MNRTSHKFIVFIICILNSGLSFSEDDIITFEQKLALSLSAKYNMGIFQQQSAAYVTDKPWDIGLGIRYKNIMAQAYIPLSFNNDSFDVALNFYLKKMYYETFIKRYTNFSMNENEQPQGKPCGIDKNFRCLIGVTYSALPKYADYSQYQDAVRFSFKFTLVTAAGY